MQCPKCGTEQADAAQCASCGIYVAKHEAYLALKTAARPKINRNERNSLTAIGIFFVGIVVLFGLGWLASGRDKGSREQATSPTLVVTTDSTFNDLANKPVPGSIRARLEVTHRPKNEIERARNATVFIQTEWGASGSGFIIDSGCRVVTNRHVVEFSEEKLRSDVASSREIQTAFVEQKQKLAVEIQRLQAAFRQALQSGASSTDLARIREALKQRGTEFDGLAGFYRSRIDKKIRDETWKYKHSLLKVSLVDGAEFSVGDVSISERYDLARFTLNAVDCPFLVAADPDDLAQGGQLFTIGNPSGLTYTVTSGVFSGFREDNGRVFLQTDAPINAGNSGGPLIDPQGRVVGINTMVLKDAQNIGFSIPVTAIEQAF